MVKKKKHEYLTESQIKDKIIQNQDCIWKPSILSIPKKIKLSSWFSIKETKLKSKNNFTKKVITEKLKNIDYKCIQVRLDLTLKQKKIINNWLNIYSKIYNATIKYIKRYGKKNEITKKFINFHKIRNALFNYKHFIVSDSKVGINDIDMAIKEACTNYKNSLDKFKKKQIKHFRMRYWRANKKIKTMGIAKSSINKNGYKSKVLGKIKAFYNGKPYELTKILCDSKLSHKNGKYFMYIPVKINKKFHMSCIRRDKIVSLDPGLKTFMTGISENKSVHIGTNVCTTIKNYFSRKDKIMNNENISPKIKKKNELMINRKISNKVDDLHWKSIKYLTSNFSTVLIGNFSSKSCVSKSGNMNKMYKRIALSLRFCDFRTKIEYKCSVKKLGFEVINEYLTSKLCSCCGHNKKDLGSQSLYGCLNCGLAIDRDINGARNILFKSL